MTLTTKQPGDLVVIELEEDEEDINLLATKNGHSWVLALFITLA